ncbi:MAG: metallophosphoesterase [Synergistaceae bacterium]|nr:metallophosphoesterase [Synergistaceae bacterium]
MGYIIGLLMPIGINYLIYRKLKEAGVSLFMRNIFILWALFWFVAGYIASYDIGNVEYDILPGRWAEILRALSLTWSIITLLAFFVFFGVDLLTGFKDFTKGKLYFALALTLAGSLYCLFEAYYVTPRYVEIKTDKLEAEKLRIVFLSDVHIGGLSTYYHLERVMKLVDEAKPDILLLGGDILDGVMSYRYRELELLTKAAEKAKYGAFAVNGNHEYYWLLDVDVEGIIRECGYNLLIFDRVEAGGIVIIGLDDIKNGWIKPYLKPEDEKKFVLVLKHRPGLLLDADGKFDLQLSGHTHGGQFWPLGYFKNRVADSVQGLSQKAGGYVYVSNGSGFNGPPMRLFVPPEITVIDIVKE